MTQTPASTDGGQAPTSGLPQAGTSTTDGQAPVSPTAPTEHERIIEQLRRENASHRADLKKYKDEELARQAAQMTELQQAQKAAADLQEQHDTMAVELLESRVHQEVGKLASKMNFVIPADILARLLLTDSEAIEFDDNAKPTNIDKLLEKLAKSAPELVKPAGQQPTSAPNIPAMSPGRSSIQQPGANQPGRVPRLSELH